MQNQIPTQRIQQASKAKHEKPLSTHQPPTIQLNRKGQPKPLENIPPTTLPWLGSKNTQDFLNATNVTLQPNYSMNQVEDIVLTPSQIAARHAIKQELPLFTGEPKM